MVVVAVVAARRSGFRRCTVAAAADSRMPSLTPVFLCFLSVCLFYVAQNTMFHLYRPTSTYVLLILPSGIPAGIPEFGISDQINLPGNDLIPTCFPTESRNAFRGFQNMTPGRNQNTKRNAHPSPCRPCSRADRAVVADDDTHKNVARSSFLYCSLHAQHARKTHKIFHGHVYRKVG